jgi:hypothetical protein
MAISRIGSAPRFAFVKSEALIGKASAEISQVALVPLEALVLD